MVPKPNENADEVRNSDASDKVDENDTYGLNAKMEKIAKAKKE